MDPLPKSMHGAALMIGKGLHPSLSLLKCNVYFNSSLWTTIAEYFGICEEGNTRAGRTRSTVALSARIIDAGLSSIWSFKH